MSILDKIVAFKKKEIEARKRLYPQALLESSKYFSSPVVSLSRYLRRKDKSGVIAEFKRRSPSNPDINLYADVETTSIGYMQAGASALSILTDNDFFGGSDRDLEVARSFNFCPILRKDFIVDSYQVYEARSIGADAILLIAEILSKEEVASLASLAKSLGLEVLMELHSKDEVSKFNDNIDVLGVNNRDLKTFKTNINQSISMFPFLPESVLKISESGIHSADQMLTLRTLGFEGFLIGEQFMKTADPAKACRQLIYQFNQIQVST